MELYRVNIKNLEDPLENQKILELVDFKRKNKVVRYRMPDDRKRSLGAGILIKKILNENGLSESSLKYSENEKPFADNLFFNISHSGDYVVGVVSDCDVGCDIERISGAPLEVAEHYFCPGELAYIKNAKNKDKVFFTLWTLKESYMKMTGRGMSLSLDSFEIVPRAGGFTIGNPPENHCFFKTVEFEDYVFSICNENKFTLSQTCFYDLSKEGDKYVFLKGQRGECRTAKRA